MSALSMCEPVTVAISQLLTIPVTAVAEYCLKRIVLKHLAIGGCCLLVAAFTAVLASDALQARREAAQQVALKRSLETPCGEEDASATPSR